MERGSFGKIVPFPNAAANDNAEEKSPKIELDVAKEASVRRLLDQTYQPGADMSLWSDASKDEARAALLGFSREDVIREINAATEEKVSSRPAYYAALIDRVDAGSKDIQEIEE